MPAVRFRPDRSSGIGKDPWAVVATAIDRTLVAGEEVILVDAAGGARTITLPLVAGMAEQDFVIVKRMNAAGGNVIVQRGAVAETVDGAASTTLAAQYDAVVLVTDGSVWHIVART